MYAPIRQENPIDKSSGFALKSRFCLKRLCNPAPTGRQAQDKCAAPISTLQACADLWNCKVSCTRTANDLRIHLAAELFGARPHNLCL